MADHGEDQPEPAEANPLAEGLRRAGISEDEIRSLLDPNLGPEARAAWQAFAKVEAKGLLDRIRTGIPGPTHQGHGRA